MTKPIKFSNRYTRLPNEDAIECICPRCQIRHRMYLHWTGRGTPRKFCQCCKLYVSSLDDTLYYFGTIDYGI